MGINLTSNFTEQAALPLDDRFIFADTTARDALAAGRRYKGMICWVLADEVHYKLKNDLVTWEALSGSGASIPDFVGDTGTGGTAGLVPAPASGDAAANKFLFSGGTWETISHTQLADIGTNSHDDIDALLVDFVGDSGTGGVTGLVPAPAAGTAAAGKFLKADGTWANPPAIGSGVGGSTITYQYIKYTGCSGYGSNSSYDAIPYFTTQNANEGASILTIANSSVYGMSLTATKRCLVTITFSASVANALDSELIGISLNSTTRGTAIDEASGRIAMATATGSDNFDTLEYGAAAVSACVVMEVDDVLRVHNSEQWTPVHATLVVTATDLEAELGIIYEPFIGATNSVSGSQGLVPMPSAGDQNKVLMGNGSWGNLPDTLPIRYGAGAPSLLTEVPTDDVELYYDTSSTAAGFVTLWMYSTVLGNWYPIKTDYFAKHIEEDIEFTEFIIRTRVRPLLEALEMSEIMHKTRLRPVTEGILISENLVVLVLTSSSPEINGSAINGAPL